SKGPIVAWLATTLRASQLRALHLDPHGRPAFLILEGAAISHDRGTFHQKRAGVALRIPTIDGGANAHMPRSRCCEPPGGPGRPDRNATCDALRFHRASHVSEQIFSCVGASLHGGLRGSGDQRVLETSSPMSTFLKIAVATALLVAAIAIAVTPPVSRSK